MVIGGVFTGASVVTCACVVTGVGAVAGVWLATSFGVDVAAQQVTNPTMPDGGALIENLGADPGGAGTLGEVTAPESYSLGEISFGG